MEKIETGIPGLDQMMEGGFPKNRTIVVIGSSGTGKSIFGMQFLVNGARKFDEPGVLVTMEESIEDVYDNYSSFNWNIKELVDSNILRIISAKPSVDIEERDIDMYKLMDEIQKNVDEIGARRITIDPISIFSPINSYETRKRISNISHMLNDLDCTSILTYESSDEFIEKSDYGVVGYVVQGIIILYYKAFGSQRRRGLEIRKMRGIKHSSRLVSFEIGKDGIKVLGVELIK